MRLCTFIKKNKVGFVLFFMMSISIVTENALASGIYSYVDSKGTWHFTNVPSDNRYNSHQRYNERPSHPKKIKFTKREKKKQPKNLTCDGKTLLKQFSSIIINNAKKHNLDPELIKAVISVESNGNCRARSRKGAMGLMQLMPSTARELGVNNPYDPSDNIAGGARYLKLMLKTFKGDMLLALAAYNAGPGAVLKYGGLPPYPETTQYVQKVLNVWYNNLRK